LTRDSLSYFDTEWENDLDNLRMLGAIQLAVHSKTGVVLAQVWDYMSAVKRGEVQQPLRPDERSG
jgi:hypothetical protein